MIISRAKTWFRRLISRLELSSLKLMFKVPNGYLWAVANSSIVNCFINNQSKSLNAFSTKYEKIILMGYFNLTIENKHLEEQLNLFNLKSPISLPTWFQSSNPTCIDLIVTNQEGMCSKSETYQVGIFDKHHLVYTMLNDDKVLKTKARFYLIEILKIFKKI